MTIWGDYRDLRHVHATIHHFAGESPLGARLNDYALGLAYDIRHAYQRSRQKKTFGIDEYDKAEYLGVNVMWPYYLSQIALLRRQAAFVPHTEGEQAGLYLLENCARTALLEFDMAIGAECVDWLKYGMMFHPDYRLAFVDHVCRDFVSSRGGKTRFRRLPELLRSLSPISDDYRDFQRELDAIAEKNGCSPHDLSDERDWPTFRW